MQGLVGFLINIYWKFIKESCKSEFCKLVKIWQNYGHEFVASLFGQRCMTESSAVICKFRFKKFATIPEIYNFLKRLFLTYVPLVWSARC